MKFRTTTLAFVLFSVLAPSLVAQTAVLRTAEDSLKSYLRKVHYGSNDQEKYEANEKFLKLMASCLADERSMKYPFDSLKNMARLYAPDESFRILNWNLPLENGSHEYFGFLQVKAGNGLEYRVYNLTDRSAEIEAPESMLLTHDRWFGALYYAIIPHKIKDKQYYTLLGWDGNDRLSKKKIIEVLSFKASGKPQFGAGVFRKYKEKDKNVRVIFEYSARAAMTLRWEEQYLRTVAQSRDKKSRTMKVKAEPMIVFDNLVPLDTRLSANSTDLIGQYQFYVPETNVLNAFILREGRWYFVKDVDARGPKTDPQKNSLKYDPGRLGR